MVKLLFTLDECPLALPTFCLITQTVKSLQNRLQQQKPNMKDANI